MLSLPTSLSHFTLFCPGNWQILMPELCEIGIVVVGSKAQDAQEMQAPTSLSVSDFLF